MALHAIRASKLRSLLTLLGIVVGIFSIISVMTAVGVLKENIESGLSQLALNRWYLAVTQGGKGLPNDSDMGEYPLWPKSFGGDTWETGSGALKHVAASWPRSVYRTKEHLTYLKITRGFMKMFFNSNS